MLGGVLLALPVHSCGLSVVDLHPVHADIAFACLRIAGDDAGQRDEAASVERPALQHWKIEHAEVFAQDYLLARRIFGCHRLREKFADFGEHGQHLQLFKEALGRFHFE